MGLARLQSTASLDPSAHLLLCAPTRRSLFDVLVRAGVELVWKAGSLGLTNCEAEFRGPGVHHRFDASDEDEYMDMDQRTRLLGGRGGRIILLGDGTEIVTGTGDDDDIDMEDRGEAEEADDSDVEEQVKKGQAESSSTNGETDNTRVQREGTPGPRSEAATEKTDEQPKPEASSTGSSSTPEEPKMKAPSDGPATQ